MEKTRERPAGPSNRPTAEGMGYAREKSGFQVVSRQRPSFSTSGNDAVAPLISFPCGRYPSFPPIHLCSPSGNHPTSPRRANAAGSTLSGGPDARFRATHAIPHFSCRAKGKDRSTESTTLLRGAGGVSSCSSRFWNHPPLDPSSQKRGDQALSLPSPLSWRGIIFVLSHIP